MFQFWTHWNISSGFEAYISATFTEPTVQAIVRSVNKLASYYHIGVHSAGFEAVQPAGFESGPLSLKGHQVSWLISKPASLHQSRSASFKTGWVANQAITYTYICTVHVIVMPVRVCTGFALNLSKDMAVGCVAPK